MTLPFTKIRFPDNSTPVSAGHEKQRALNFAVPVRCSAMLNLVTDAGVLSADDLGVF